MQLQTHKATVGRAWLSCHHAVVVVPGLQAVCSSHHNTMRHNSGTPFSLFMLCLARCAVLVFAAGKAFLPGSPAFATLVIWICSVAAAQIAHWVGDACSRCCVHASSRQAVSQQQRSLPSALHRTHQDP